MAFLRRTHFFRFSAFRSSVMPSTGSLLPPLLTDAVVSLQVFHELAGEQKTYVQSRTMFFEITQAHPSISTQRALLFFGQAKVGQQVISVAMTDELHGEILAFRCIKKAAMVLKVSLQAITAWFSTVYSRMRREGETFPCITASPQGRVVFRSADNIPYKSAHSAITGRKARHWLRSANACVGHRCSGLVPPSAGSESTRRRRKKNRHPQPALPQLKKVARRPLF